MQVQKNPSEVHRRHVTAIMTHHSGSENPAETASEHDDGPAESPFSPPNQSENRLAKPVLLFRSFEDGLPAKVVGPKGASDKVEGAMRDFAARVIHNNETTPDIGMRVSGADTQGNGILYACPEDIVPSAPQIPTVIFEEENVKVMAFPTGLSTDRLVLVQVTIPKLPISHHLLGKGGSADLAPPFALDIVKGLYGQILSWVRTGPTASTLFAYKQKKPVGISMTVFVPKTSRLSPKSVLFEISFRVADGSPVCKFCKGFHPRKSCKAAHACSLCGSTAHSPSMCTAKPRRNPAAKQHNGKDQGFTTVTSKQSQLKQAAKQKAAAREAEKRAKLVKARAIVARLRRKAEKKKTNPFSRQDDQQKEVENPNGRETDDDSHSREKSGSGGPKSGHIPEEPNSDQVNGNGQEQGPTKISARDAHAFKRAQQNSDRGSAGGRAHKE